MTTIAPYKVAKLPRWRALGTLCIAMTSTGCDDGGTSATSEGGTRVMSSDAAIQSVASASVSSASSAAPSAEDAIPAPGTPLVDLAGVTSLPAALAADASRVGAMSWVTRVHATASREGKVIGFLRTGAVVPASGSKNTMPTADCDAGWRHLLPVGFVCMDDMTDDMQSTVLRAASRRPDYTHRLPYMYGIVTRGGPVYAKVPSRADLDKYEPNLKRHLRKWEDDKRSGATYGLDVWLRYTPGRPKLDALQALEQNVTDDDLIPHFLRDEGRSPNVSGRVKSADAIKIDQVDRRQGRSFINSFLVEGRRYNVTPDLVVVPADRFRPIRGSSFSGWHIGAGELKTPFALIRRRGAKKWSWRGGKPPQATGKLDYRSSVQLTGKQQIHKSRLYYETTEGFYVDSRHASRVDPAKRWPKWAKQGAKWIDVRLSTQVLVAYEGKKMVFATLISSGEAGLEDPTTSTATTRGIFRIHTKHVSITMDSNVVGEEFELRDVPYVQYFEGGYALHGAYWHDSFGRPKSHGCINLAPEDARRIFFWTDPPVPYGWHGARTSLTGTIVFVHP